MYKIIVDDVEIMESSNYEQINNTFILLDSKKYNIAQLIKIEEIDYRLGSKG